MFLEKVVGLTEMRTIIRENSHQLTPFVAGYAQKVAGEHVDLPSIQNLKKNYQTFISVLNQQNNQQINKYSLHLIATVSTGYLKFNQIDQAKEILKKSQAFLEGTYVDPLLLAACLNNLANIQKLKKKYYKSLRVSLKALEVMTNHMETLRQRKQKQKLREDAVVYLIVIIRCKLTLSTILSKNNKKFFQKAYELMNYLGYRSCLRYLGKESIFIKRFTPVEREFHLPIFKTQEKIQKRPQNQNEILILEQLNKIHEVLKAKQNPDIVVYANQPQSKVLVNKSEMSIIINQVRENQPIQKELPKIPKSTIKQSPKRQEPTPEIVIEDPTISIEEQLEQVEQLKTQSIRKQPSQVKENQHTPEYVASESDSASSQSQEPVVVEQTIFIDKWQLKIRCEWQKQKSLGQLSIESYRTSVNKKKRQSRVQSIDQTKLEKIMSQINLQDILPYEFFGQKLEEEQFIEYNIKPFLDVDKEGQAVIYPKSKGLFEPVPIKLFGQDSLLFFNHVRTNLFRISISQLFSFKSIYLNVELSSESMSQYFTFEEEINDIFTAIFKSIENDSNVGVPYNIKDKNKTCHLLKKQELIKYLQEIVAEFERILMNRQDQTAINEILDNQLFYYKYMEIGIDKKGMYYVIRYLPAIKSFDVYLQNNYLTYAIDEKSKARGNARYNHKAFHEDFGVHLKYSLLDKKLFAYLQIIAKKYTLMTFQSPLSKNDQDAYTENAIMQFPIVESCFKTKMYLKDNFYCPITVSLLTVNNQFPVGIKVTEYEPGQCLTRGYFIHLVPQEWARPLRRPSPWVNKNLFKTFINEFDYRRQYFIAEWLQKKGLELLFQKLLNPEHVLYLPSSINRFIRSKNLVDIFNANATS